MRRTPAFLLFVLAPLLVSDPALAVWPADGAVVTAATNAQRQAKITSDGAGGAIITWLDRRPGTDEDIYAQRIDADGVVQWTAGGVAVCAFPQDQLAPSITPDGAGGAIIAWHDTRDVDADVYAQRIDPSGAPMWTANGKSTGALVNGQFNPVLVSDGAGGAVIAWQDFRTGTSMDVYALRIDAAGNWAWNASKLICNAAGTQNFIQITTDGAGGAIISWQDARGSTNDIYAQRIDTSGTALWTANGVPVCMAASEQVEPVIASDGAGGVIIAWYDYRNLGTSGVDMYAQRIDENGAEVWTTDGVPVCKVPGSTLAPVIVADGFGGAIIAWQDGRNGNDDIYAQRVDASGNPVWFIDGMAICTAASVQRDPDLVSDGAGGAVIAWRDARNGASHDIYAQRIDATGNTQWIHNGVVLCAAAETQSDVVVATDGAGGAIAAWTDPRNSTASDIYAQRATAVPTGVGDTPRAPALSLLRIHPNPFTGSAQIEVDLPAVAVATVEVFDVAGRRVRAMSHAPAGAGVQQVPFDGRDDAGRPLAGGVYFCRVTAGGVSVAGKMVIAR